MSDSRNSHVTGSASASVVSGEFRNFPLQFVPSNQSGAAESIDKQVDLIVEEIKKAKMNGKIVGLTYSANRAQFEALRDYYLACESTDTALQEQRFNRVRAEFRTAANQGAVMRKLMLKLERPEFLSLQQFFRILPISTMERSGGPTTDAWLQEEMLHIRKFAIKYNSIILGWQGYVNNPPPANSSDYSIGGGISGNAFSKEQRAAVMNYLNQVKAAMSSKTLMPYPDIPQAVARAKLNGVAGAPNASNTDANNQAHAEANNEKIARERAYMQRCAKFQQLLAAENVVHQNNWAKIEALTDEELQRVSKYEGASLSAKVKPSLEIATGAYEETAAQNKVRIYYDRASNSVRPVTGLPVEGADRAASIYAMVKFLRDAGNPTVYFDCKHPALLDPQDLQWTIEAAKDMNMTVEMLPSVREVFINTTSDPLSRAPLQLLTAQQRLDKLKALERAMLALQVEQDRMLVTLPVSAASPVASPVSAASPAVSASAASVSAASPAVSASAASVSAASPAVSPVSSDATSARPRR